MKVLRPLPTLGLATALFAGVASALLLAAACSGSNSSPSSPSPTPSPSPSGSAITINIVDDNGKMSFSPDTMSVSAGQQIVFHNQDSEAHHPVQDGGAWDAGNLAPGQTSSPITIKSTSAQPFHCTIHPDMVGALNGSVSDTPAPCEGLYCG